MENHGDLSLKQKNSWVGLEEKEIYSLVGRCYLSLVNKSGMFETSNSFFII